MWCSSRLLSVRTNAKGIPLVKIKAMNSAKGVALTQSAKKWMQTPLIGSF